MSHPRWKLAKCSDIIDVRDGTHDTPPKVAEGYPLVTSKNLKNGKIDFSDVTYISEESFREVEKRSGVDDGDVLMAMIGTIGSPVLVAKECDFAIKNVALFKLPKEKVDGSFFVHLLNSPSIWAQLNQNSRGGNQKFVSLTVLRELWIPDIPLSEQKRIAEILDRAEALRAKRRAALALLDELTQSIFLDMFGDPAVNPKGFPIKVLSELYINPKDGTKCGPFGSALKKHEYVESGVAVWNMDNIDPAGRMVLPFRMWITESKYRKLNAYSVMDGDIIISRAGTVGKMCVTKLGSLPSIISTNLIRLRLGPNLLPIHFVSLMLYCTGRIRRLKTGTDGAFTHMSTGILDTLRFPYPPLDLQHQFAAIVGSMDRQKETMLSQLTELDQLFASLQHRAFRGEL